MTGASRDSDVMYPLPATEGFFVAESRANPVRDKSFEFALEMIKLNLLLAEEREYVISKQLLRSGTAVGAIIEEAIGAESRKDFLHKMSIAHKEAREVHYWLRLLDQSELLAGQDLTRHIAMADELVRLLTAITRSVKESTKK